MEGPLGPMSSPSAQVKACSGFNGSEEFLPQLRVGGVQGKFEEIDAGGGGGKPVRLAAWIDGEVRNQLREPQQWRLGARCHKLEEKTLLLLCKLLEDLPEPRDNRVVNGQGFAIVCEVTEILDVNRHLGPGNEGLELDLVKESQPAELDQRGESGQEGLAGLVDLVVELVKRHEVNVVHPISIRHREVLPSRNEFYLSLLS